MTYIFLPFQPDDFLILFRTVCAYNVKIAIFLL